MFLRFCLTGATTALALSIASSALAQDTDAQIDKLMHALEVQGKKLAAQERALADQQRKLQNDEAEFNRLRAQVEKVSGRRMQVAQAPASVSASVAGNSSDIPQEVGTDHKQQQPEKPPEVAKYIEEGGVLLHKGQLMITPGIEYDRSSATNVAIQGFSIIPALNIGDFEVAKVSQDLLIGTMDARLGLTNRFEIEAKLPYVYGTQGTLGRPIGVGSSNDSLTNINGSGLGDLEFGAHYQVNKGLNDWPFFIANLRYKTTTGEGPFEIPVDSFGQQTRLPTGSGFDAVQPSVTILYPSDPVVFYSNLGYTHNLEKSFPTYGSIQPGDSINASFGMSTSLNEATSLSLGYSHSMVFNTTQNGHALPGSEYLQVGAVDIGWGYSLNDRVSLNLNVSIGVTSDAPSDRVILRVPVAFDVF